MTTVQAAGLGLAIAVVLMIVIWLASLVRRDASLVDRFWGAGFALLALGYWGTAPPVEGRAAVGRLALLVMVLAWGLRLSGYLTWRNWGRGEDYRYREMRARGGRSFPLTSLVTVHLLQGGIMWFVSLVLMAGLRGAPRLSNPWFGLGAALWAIGLFFETAGDWQLARFRADPANLGQVLDRGVWRYSRHPNYFGDAAAWWGFYLCAGAGDGWWAVVSPVVMTGLLLKVSGVVMLERRLTGTKPQYRDYMARTSPFLPLPPRRDRT